MGDIVWILCADHVFWYPWPLSISVYRRASASVGVHRASACRDRGTSTRGRVHSASANSDVRTDSINTFPNSSFCGGLLSCSCGAGEHNFPSVIFVSYRGNADFLLTVTQHRRDPFLLRLELLIASSR